jgi:hypothetical protein
MTIRVSTWHSAEFDILTEFADPSKSPYAESVRDYAARVTAFYGRLGVRSAIWAFPEAEQRNGFDLWKPVEYLLAVDEERVVAYVGGVGWEKYLHGEQAAFECSKIPEHYAGGTTILISTPIKQEEVTMVRRYRRIDGLQLFELIEEISSPDLIAKYTTRGDCRAAGGS